MKKRGAPTKFNDALKDQIVALYRPRPGKKKPRTDKEVAEIIGVSVRSLQNWKGKHVDFLHSIKDAKMVADQLVVGSIWQSANGYSHEDEKILVIDKKVQKIKTTKHYPPNIQAAKYWLNNRHPRDWKNNRKDTIAPPPPPETELTQLTDEQLRERMRKNEELLRKGIEKLSGKKPDENGS